MNPSIAEYSALLSNGEISSAALTERYLSRIKQQNVELNAYLFVNEELSMQQAHTADERRKSGSRVTALTGVPLAIKDIMHVPGMPTTCASRMLKDFQPTYTSTAIARLLNDGAVILGKTNMDEFAMGASTENSAFGVTRNPWNHNHTPGGSSGGSAAAVAADLCAGALGTDTGGSIRQPAGLCGIVGLKPTYGRVSRYGMVAFASSLDQIGPMTHTVRDAAILLQSIAGYDENDSTSLNVPVPDYDAGLRTELKGMNIGVVEEYLQSGSDEEVTKSVKATINKLKDLGANIIPVELPHAKYAVPVYYIIAPAEASSNLARYDGVRYGYRAEGVTDLNELYKKSRSEGFGPEVIRRIILGTYVLSSGYYDAYYRKAQQIRRLIVQDYKNAFANVDAIIMPTTPYTAFELGVRHTDPVQMYLSDICTSSCNLAGLPGISIPCGISSNNLPIGVQVIGKHLDEATVLGVAHAFEQATDWHTKRPTK